ncbi:MAG: L,D-transpeptidase family protein, partial [Firmicutes bacterium]|nr:L,D-transpeptidase family protein [Bacillota bacterium]
MKKTICILLAVLMTAFSAVPAFAADPSTAANTKNNGSPYYIMVNRKANCVTVYGLDPDGYYSIPVRAMVASTGRAGCETPPGTFSISNRAAWMYMADGSYGQYATRFNGAILFHSVCYKRKDPSTLMTYEYNALGGFASLGCVRLQTADAKWVFDNCPQGTKVIIYDGDDPGPLGKPDTLVPQISEAQDNGWDPTDPRQENPWKSVIGDKAGTTSALSGLPFKDVTLRNWFFPQVLGAYRADLMRGTAADTFSPQTPLTYAQALQLVYNLRTDKTPVAAEGAWYAPALKWAGANGVTLPEDAAFDPNAPIPRQMFALYLFRMSGGSAQDPDGTLTAFSDADRIMEGCRPAMAWAVEQG